MDLSGHFYVFVRVLIAQRQIFDNKEGDKDDEIDEVDPIAESDASQEDSHTEI